MPRAKKTGSRQPRKLPRQDTSNLTLVEKLRAENEDLKQRLQRTEQERDHYRDAVYAWARGQFQPEDFRRALAEKDGLPLAAFIDELEHEGQRS